MQTRRAAALEHRLMGQVQLVQSVQYAHQERATALEALLEANQTIHALTAEVSPPPLVSPSLLSLLLSLLLSGIIFATPLPLTDYGNRLSYGRTSLLVLTEHHSKFLSDSSRFFGGSSSLREPSVEQSQTKHVLTQYSLSTRKRK
jgi:hypothetical protein